MIPTRQIFAAAALTTFAAILASCTGTTPSVPGPASAGDSALPNSTTFNFTTLDDQADPTFNRLLGINNDGRLGGYYGDGSSSSPNRGYVVYAPYAQSNYRNENFPSAVGTIVTSVNDTRETAGYYVDVKGRTLSFILSKGIWSSYEDGNSTVTEMFGLNDDGYGVGFYLTKSGASTPFEVNQVTGVFQDIDPPGGTNAVAGDINGVGDIVGYMTVSSGNVVSWMLRKGKFKVFSYPGATATEATGITLQDRIAGTYTDSYGKTHGFLVTDIIKKTPIWQSIDDPNGVGTTSVSELNVHNDLVGWYVDSAGTHGFLATPSTSR